MPIQIRDLPDTPQLSVHWVRPTPASWYELNAGLLETLRRLVRPTPASWHELNAVDLSANCSNKARGVYLIWRGEESLSQAVVIYVGQGNIRERLSEHRRDPEIQKHGSISTLFVTWAEVSNDNLDGVEEFLAQIYRPRVGQHYGSVPHITVNWPFYY